MLLVMAGMACAGERSATGGNARPATAPAEEPIDGLASYNRAMATGDERTMLARQHADTPAQQRLARVAARSDAMVAKLVSAVVARFGADAGPAVARAIGDVRVEDIRQTRVEGERAELLGEDGQRLVALVRVEGKWKIDLTELAGDDDTARASTDNILRTLNLAKVLRQDVEAGRYASAAALVSAIEAARGQ